MSAIFGPLVPDTISTSQTWAVKDMLEYKKLLDGVLKQLYSDEMLEPEDWMEPENCMKCAERNDEWSGSGIYRLQIRMNRPEGRPLYSLKWEGPL